MRPRPLSPDACRLLDGANFAHLSTLMPTGEPKVDPVWVGREDDQIIVTTDARSRKALNAAHDPRVALSVIAFDDPYDQLLVRGHVLDLRPDDELAALDALSQKYLGTPFPRRKWTSRVVLVVQPSVVRSYRSPLRDPRTGP